MEDVGMGFFSDLKEDLSQAVNELMPEEGLEAALAESEAGDGILHGRTLADEELMMPKKADFVDLNSMLDKLDEPAADEWGPLEEEVISPVQETETADNLSMAAGQISEPSVMEEPELKPEEAAVEAILSGEIAQESVPEPEISPAEEPEENGTISELNGEEEKTMDVQTQEQTQAPAKRVAVDETAVVTEGMTITGDIVSQGSMELIGTVNGNLDIYGKLNITGTIQGDSKAAEIYAEGANIAGEVNSEGSVKIGQSSVVIGNIMAASAVIAGAVKGDIDVKGPVILDTTAIVMGNIKSKSVQINNGAVIEGLCSQCYADVNPVSFFEEFKKRK